MYIKYEFFDEMNETALRESFRDSLSAVFCAETVLVLQKRIENINKASGRCESMTAWKLLADIMKELGEKELSVRFSENGKPYFENSEYFFSLSHSSQMAICVASESPVGIDTECVEGRRLSGPLKKLFEEGMSNTEILKCWCTAEAYTKLTGEGIKKIRELLPNPFSHISDRYVIKELEVPTPYIAVVVSEDTSSSFSGK